MSGTARAGEARFASTVFIITGGLLLWIANFVLVYSFAAVACARGFADFRLAGIGIVPVVGVVSTIACALVTGALLMRARRTSERAEGRESFTRFVAVATCSIALLAFVFFVLPLVFVPGCVDVTAVT